MERFDIAVIGAGIAGVSAAARLARTRRVVLLEREARAGYHASGRSAALFSETYGNDVVRALTTASRAFLEAPGPGFGDHPILTPRGALVVGMDADSPHLDRAAAEGAVLVPSVRRVGSREVLALCPALRPEAVGGGGVHEPDAQDIDTSALIAGFLRLLREAGGVARFDSEVRTIERVAGGVRIATRSGVVEAALVVNAAGAWADPVAQAAGLPGVGVEPRRRTAFLVDPPAGTDVSAWPLVIRAGEDVYFKPDAGRLLVSPADETPSLPCDAAPEEFDIAVAVDRLEALAAIAVTRIVSRWAGLRSFARDRTPVVGFDPAWDRFVWLAGQGGYGFQTASALADAVSDLVDGREPPFAAALSPGRFAAQAEGTG